MGAASARDYKVGEHWYSFDNGKTWTREKPEEHPGIYMPTGHAIVTQVDHVRGEITIKVDNGR